MQLWRQLFGGEPEEPSLARIRRSFELLASDEEHFPSSIDPRILHARVIVEGAAGAGRVLDAGCGKGRFARLVAEANPSATVVAMDLAMAMLRAAPPTLARSGGTLTALPYRDEAFDFAYATESLEHAVDIETAVSELCRVVRPGGRIVVIDKNAEHWGRLKTPVWEKWFGAQELEALLGRHCREVSSAPISYWDDVPADGLFLCWRAVK